MLLPVYLNIYKIITNDLIYYLKNIMKKILTNWKHLPGLHCGSVAIRDIVNFYNISMSEELCFGLGGGLGFYNSTNSHTPTRSIHVRGPWMESGFFNHFGFGYKDWQYEDDNEKAHKLLIESINKDVPVLIQTDIYYLDYYNSGTHFPGHIVVVCGYDEDNQLFYLADTAYEDIKEVSFDKMKLARNSKYEPYPLRNNYLNIDLKFNEVDLNTAVPGAISMNARYMQNGTETVRGKSGIEEINCWSDELPGWKNIDDWKWSSRFAYQVISRRGVDGAAFRWMYRDFLKQVEDYCPTVVKMGLAGEMNIIGAKWSELSVILKNISELNTVTTQFEEASETARNIYILERNFYSKVLENSELSKF